MTFIRVAFYDRELPEGAPCLANQAWLLMGTMRASALFLLIQIILGIESLRASIFILLFTRTSRICHLFNGFISDIWLFCLFCAWSTRHFTRGLSSRWTRTCSSWPMKGIPRFRFTLAASVLPNDILISWRYFTLIVLIFALIQIIAARAVICLLQLRRRKFLIILNNMVRFLLIYRLKQRATKISRDKEAIIWFTVNTIACWTPLCIVCIIEIIFKTSMTLQARWLWKLTRVGKMRHISRRA